MPTPLSGFWPRSVSLKMTDTAKDPRLGRIFEPDHARLSGLRRLLRHGRNRRAYRRLLPARRARPGRARRSSSPARPVGGGKSPLAERLKSLMEVHPIYVLKAGDELSPVFESLLSLFDPESLGPMIEAVRHPRRRLSGLMSPWCYKRLEAFGGDISRFRVARIQPSRLRQIAIAKTETGRREQSGYLLAGRQGRHPQAGDLLPRTILMPTATPAAGTANCGHSRISVDVQGADRMLHPLLTATQESNYIGTENIGAILMYWRRARALERIRMAKLQGQQEQRSLHRSQHLRHQGAVLPAGHRGAEDLRG